MVITAPLLVLIVKVKRMRELAYQAHPRTEPEPVYDANP
jgi:hypothetical protein